MNKNSILATKRSSWECLPFHPKKLITLAQMVRCIFSDLNEKLIRVDSYLHHYSQKATLSGQAGTINGNEKRAIEMLLSGIKAIAYQLELTQTEGYIFQIQLGFLEGHPLPLYSVLTNQMQTLWNTMWNDLNGRVFAYFPGEKAALFDRDDLFGPDVARAFPSAEADIRLAGTCLSADLHTAGVFHLMCIVEIGLRALARQLRVRTVKKTTPIELGTWGDIIQKLEEKVNSRFPRSKKGQAESDFYKGLFIEFRAIKDFWRDKTMHARMVYDEDSAQSAFTHVQAFMQRLATKVSEA